MIRFLSCGYSRSVIVPCPSFPFAVIHGASHHCFFSLFFCPVSHPRTGHPFIVSCCSCSCFSPFPVIVIRASSLSSHHFFFGFSFFFNFFFSQTAPLLLAGTLVMTCHYSSCFSLVQSSSSVQSPLSPVSAFLSIHFAQSVILSV